MSEVIEKMIAAAQAATAQAYVDGVYSAGDHDNGVTSVHARVVRAAIAAAESAGYVLVPRGLVEDALIAIDVAAEEVARYFDGNVAIGSLRAVLTPSPATEGEYAQEPDTAQANAAQVSSLDSK